MLDGHEPRFAKQAPVLLDIFGRYVVGWMIAHAHRESATLAKKLIEESTRTGSA